MSAQDVLKAAQAHAVAYMEVHFKPEFTYHDMAHTEEVVAAVRELSAFCDLDAEAAALLEIAAWFHDTGYAVQPDGHEAIGADLADAFMQGKLPEEAIDTVRRCIMATKMPQRPNDLMERIICDADMAHLGLPTYWDRNYKLREELRHVRQVVMREEQWLKFELEFLENHDYHTEAAQALYGTKKAEHQKIIGKQRKTMFPTAEEQEAKAAKQAKKAKKQEKAAGKKAKKQNALGRGVETMYRSTYRTHINLSSIADNKANIMLSINAIVVSIVISSLVPRFGEMPRLIAPTILLLVVCLTAMVFATLSTKPKITEGRFTREDIEQKRANLLFFGNYYNMPLKDYQFGMGEMLNDPEFLYNSMNKDLYFLGVVLAKKYKYLSLCYSVFMYGLILSVAAFALAFA